MLRALQLPDTARARLHVAGLALSVLGAFALLWGLAGGAYVALVGLATLAFFPRHPSEGR